jgi:hypothetical protein
MKYRIQRRPLDGFKRRGWGFGRVMSYGKWKTFTTRDTEAEARDEAGRLRRLGGLWDWRILHGKETIEP